ncbi:hypothetical protein E3T26_08615 [Cryobacterium sp. TMT1-21]|uniref:hypothetical protein n=1 Tax=Cryobacterium sp. TMT1-21 TaxID=1259234 RepID=UPI00106BECF1|nr:hypothetical protein [Cryobacterium sp. TMT1-21]TFD14176.1 hypothetical protein E3T26_08615 [Cryobacterium sp. TMT1-21]
MSELINRIPGNKSAMAALKLITQTTAELKARQRITGRSGQLGYTVSSANDWDYIGLVTYTNSTYNLGVFRITFTGDGTQRFPIAVPQFDIRINGTGQSSRMIFNADSGKYEYNDAAVEVQAFQYGRPVEDLFENELQSAWSVELFFIGKTGSGNFALNIKSRAQSTCKGVFSIVRLS